VRSAKRLDGGASSDVFYKRFSAHIGAALSRGRTAGEREIVGDLAFELAVASAMGDSNFKPLQWFRSCGFLDPDAAAQRVLAEVERKHELQDRHRFDWEQARSYKAAE
jgi:hypothetical protein